MNTKFLFVIGILFCWIVNASDQMKSKESSVEWSVNYLKDGTSRFEFFHVNKTHFYEIKLTGIDIDGETMILPEPVISVQKNQVTKQWLPYLKETWIKTQGLFKWSFEVDRPDFLHDTAKKITLKYDVDTNGKGGLTVGDDTAILFDVDASGKIIHELNNQERRKVSISVFGSRCWNATSIAGYPSKNKSVVFNLNKKSFPLFTQGYVKGQIYSFDMHSSQNSSWNRAKFSEQDNVIQLVVPTTKMVNDEMVDSFKIFQQRKSRGNVVASNRSHKSHVSMIEVNEQDIFGFIKPAGNWHQIMMDRINFNRWKSYKKSDINYLEKIKHALLSLGNLAVNYIFGKPVVFDGEYLYAISNGSTDSKIFILKKEGDQWIKQDPIVIQRKVGKVGPFEVSRKIEEVNIKNDLMVVSMQVASYTVPRNSEDNQSLGEVRVYRKVNNQWLLEKKLVPEVGNSEDSFGEVVVVGNNMIVVSASDYTQENDDSLNGIVHMYNYTSGKWQKPVIIKPPDIAKDSGYFDNQGFGSQLQLHGDDLYVKASSQGYSSNTVNQLNESVDCPYFDSFGVIYHYRKVNNQWRFQNEIKSKEGASSLIGPMLANSTGLYFLTLSYGNSLPNIFMKHYSDGKINWQIKLSN